MRLHLFRGLAALLALILLAFGGQLLFAGWSSPDHAVHELSWGVHEGLLLAFPLLFCLRRPERHPATFRLVLAGMAALLVTMALVATVDPFTLVLAAMATGLLALHPARSRVLAFSAPRWPVAIVVVGVPLLLFALDQAGLQRTAADSHAALDHYTGTTLAAIGLLFALVVTLGTRTERAPAWFTGLGFSVLGLASLLFPDQVSSLGPAWAAATLACGAGLVIALGRPAPRRAQQIQPDPTPAI